jgi:hypothetical protein
MNVRRLDDASAPESMHILKAHQLTIDVIVRPVDNARTFAGEIKVEHVSRKLDRHVWNLIK